MNNKNVPDRKAMRRLQDNLHVLITWFLGPASRVLDQENAYPRSLLAENICIGYQNLSVDCDCTHRTEIMVPELKDHEYLRQDSEYLKPVLDLKLFAREELNEYLLDFLIHGSMATLDYSKGWSDFDTYLVIKKKTLFSATKLLELRDKLLIAYKYLLAIDPLQHHGFLVCTEYDLAAYPSFYMPVEVLKLSKSLFRTTPNLKIDAMKTEEEAKGYFLKLVKMFKEAQIAGEFKRHPYNGEYLLSEFRNAENGLYQLKNFLGYIVTLPAYYLSAEGKPCYKKQSFDKVRKAVSGKGWNIVVKATKVRQLWQEKEKIPYHGNAVPEWVRELLGKDYIKEGYVFVKELESLLQKSLVEDIL